MAPGAKKKNSNRKTIDSLPDGKKNLKNNFADKPDSISNIPLKELECDQIENQDKRYSKRGISSNWQKYDEVPSDPHTDTTRGKDLEVLLSYSGGSGSQFQFQGEKDWEDSAIDDKTIAIDIKDLVHVVKAIPFHEQLNLSASIFTKSQLAKFNTTAETWKRSYIPVNSSKTISDKDSKLKKEITKVQESLDSSLNIIDNSNSEEVEVIVNKPVLLETKTESIIESLASCVSLKSPISEKNILKEDIQEETQTFTDDLDFLLSLNASLKTPIQEEKQSEKNKTNVDDWLNNLLDD